MKTREPPAFDQVKVGDVLPSLVTGPITRAMLAVYCGASGDHNPVHVDIDFARESGLDDVIAHGMLVMAYSARVLTDWIPQHCIREIDTRFQAPTRIGDVLTASATIVDRYVEDGRRLVRLEIGAVDQHGEAKTRGNAIVELP